MKRILTLLSLLLFTFSALCQSMKVEITGDVSFNNSQYTIGEAGEDFSPSIESESSIYLSVDYTNYWDKVFNPNRKWKIHVHKADIKWNQNLVIEAKRSGNGSRPWYGTGMVKIGDGINFQPITNAPTYFFNGRNEILNIPIVFKIRGASVVMGAQEFETNIILTVYDDW